MSENNLKLSGVSQSQYIIRLVIVSLFCAFALALYFLGNVSFLCVLLIFFGALWNFFVPINTYISFVFCLVVCLIYSMFAIEEGLYASAILYFFVYVFMQCTVWVLYSDENTKIENKQLSQNASYYAICAIIVGFTICFAISLIQEKHVLPFFDAMTACMLGLSAFLQSFKYREYFIIRPIALVLAILLWFFIGYRNGFDGISISILLMYSMYLLLDLIFIGYRVYDLVFSEKKHKEKVRDIEIIENKKNKFKKLNEIDKDDDYKGNIKA